MGKEWLPCKTLTVGIRGATLEIDVALVVGGHIEYIVVFPAELTHAVAPLRVRFSGRVLRVDSRGENAESYLVAVHNDNYKFLRDPLDELFGSGKSEPAAQAEEIISSHACS